MDMFFYIVHRIYNALREFAYPSLAQYRRYKQKRKRVNKRLWKEKAYKFVD